MSGYLKLARRSRTRREESCHCPTSEAATGMQPVRHNQPIHFGPEGRRLQSARFEPKERGGKVIWERPDTGFWVSQEMALHLLERKSAEERRA